jgi:hypothetical protein
MAKPDGGPPGSRPAFPLLVRALAVVYVLLRIVQPLGFLLLGGTAAILYGMKGHFDARVLWLTAGAAACLVLCTAFRWWFERWGRRRYPQAMGQDQGRH